MFMHSIFVEKFGPIDVVDIKINDLMVFIGPQASGKSTIAKNIYFFRSLKEELVRQLFLAIQTGDATTVSLKWFKGRIINRFVGFWGTTGHLDPFKIVYTYSNKKTLTLSLHKGRVQPEFSPAFGKELDGILYELQQFLGKRGSFNGSSISLEAEEAAFQSKLEELASSLFEDYRTSLFIPAGRSLLSTLSGPLQATLFSNIHRQPWEKEHIADPYLLDDTLKTFINRINRTKGEFSQDLETMIANSQSVEPLKGELRQVLGQTITIFDRILQGRYKVERDSERIQLPNSDKYVKLSFASSGQQEVVWMLLQLFSLMLNRQATYLLIEEPEVHLFPKAQNEIVELLCLFANLGGNQVTLTTHSPYILSALNNFIYAGKLGRTKPNEVRNIMLANTWMLPDRVSAYFLEHGQLRSIMDEELELIKVEEIDRASFDINAQFDRLFQLEEQ